MNDEPKKLKKPADFSELYPGRFIKAGELLGKKVTLTIADIDLEELVGDNGPQVKCVISFKETQKKHVACKTNGLCIKAMFGKKLSDWVGKRITLFEDQWNGEPATRIWGSPDIVNDMQVEIALPRRRPFKRTLHCMAPKGDNGVSKTASYLGQMTGHEAPEYAEEQA
jgi:hypothetical protein